MTAQHDDFRVASALAIAYGTLRTSTRRLGFSVARTPRRRSLFFSSSTTFWRTLTICTLVGHRHRRGRPAQGRRSLRASFIHFRLLRVRARPRLYCHHRRPTTTPAPAVAAVSRFRPDRAAARTPHRRRPPGRPHASRSPPTGRPTPGAHNNIIIISHDANCRHPSRAYPRRSRFGGRFGHRCERRAPRYRTTAHPRSRSPRSPTAPRPCYYYVRWWSRSRWKKWSRSFTATARNRCFSSISSSSSSCSNHRQRKKKTATAAKAAARTRFFVTPRTGECALRMGGGGTKIVLKLYYKTKECFNLDIHYLSKSYGKITKCISHNMFQVSETVC